MALPLPEAPLALPTFNEDRGGNWIATEGNGRGSSRSKPSVYTDKDVCDQDAYRVGSISMSISQQTDDCRTVSAGGGSLKVRIPIDATAADVNLIVNHLRDQLIAGFAFS